MLRFLVSITWSVLFIAFANAQNQDSFGDCSPNVTGFLGGVDVENCIIYKLQPQKNDLADGNLAVHFSRLPVRLNTASIMKLAEGAVFEPSPEWSSEYSKQFWITDGEKKFGLVTETMVKIWEKHAFNGSRPVGTPFWRTISGNDNSIMALSLLAFIASLDREYSHDKMALDYACYEVTLLDRFDCFCPGQIFERTAESSLGKSDVYDICLAKEVKLSEFFFTLMNIENTGERPIKNLELSLRDSTGERVRWIRDVASIFSECGMQDQLEEEALKADKFHVCVNKFFSDIEIDSPEVGQYATLGMSTLPPGESIILLLNSYIPDTEGLPEKYIMGHLHVDKIDYLENGRSFSIMKPTPLADRRIPVIMSPIGGRGGQ